MTEPRLEPAGEGFRLVGDLSFESVPGLYRRSSRLFQDVGAIHVDLSGVGRSDSAGLALLVEWMRLARRDFKPLTLVNAPEQLLALARISGIAELLPLQAR